MVHSAIDEDGDRPKDGINEDDPKEEHIGKFYHVLGHHTTSRLLLEDSPHTFVWLRGVTSESLVDKESSPLSLI